MTVEEHYEQLWGGLSERPAPTPCTYATLLASWAEPMVSAAERQADLMRIAHTKLLLLEKFMTIRAHTPKPHRYKMALGGHICLWQKFEEFYDRLCIAEIPLTRPLFLPEPAAPVNVQPIDTTGQLFIGLKDDE